MGRIMVRAAAELPASPPRWFAHPYNRAILYRVAAAAHHIPRAGRLRLARWLARMAASLLPVERAAIRNALATMTGATGRRLDELTLELFGHFGMYFSDLVSTNREPAERFMKYVGRPAGAERLIPAEQGVIFLTAHVGNWELAGRLLAVGAARPTHVVVAAEEARELERWVRRDGDRVRFVPRSRPTVSLDLLAALRRGDVVAMQGDRALGTRGDVRVPFFGRPAPFPIGPFVLARAAAVPIVAAFCVLGADDRYTLRVCEPRTVKSGDEEDALRAWVAHLEDVVRHRPTHWFNFFDIWNPYEGGGGGRA
jgi:lauroyl/myristoyl acyltransferase